MTAITLTFPAGAYAQQQADSLGLGLQTCEAFLAAREMNSKLTDLTFMSWASGFMTAANLGNVAEGHTEKNLAGMSLELQAGVARQYCHRNPEKTFTDAVVDLYAQLPEFEGDGD